MTSTRNSACTTPASGLVAPLRMLVAVRAMAPVAANPPNNGARMFATPWPISSWFESWRVPVMPSATTAVSSDSMAPSNAMANAGPTSCRTVAERQCRPRECRQLARNAAEGAADRGDARELPDRLHGRRQRAWRAAAPARARARGTFAEHAVAGAQDRQRTRRRCRVVARCGCRSACTSADELLVKVQARSAPDAGRRNPSTGRPR